MNASYKIVLLGAFILFVAIIGYYALSSGKDPEHATANPPSDPDAAGVNDRPTPTPEPRETPDVEPTPAREVTIDVPNEPEATTDRLSLRDDRTPLRDGVIEPGHPILEHRDNEPVLIDPETGAIDEPLIPRRRGPEIDGVAPEPEVIDPTPEPIEPAIEPEQAPDSGSDDEETLPHEETFRPGNPGRTYTIVAGDTLASIAVRVYGEERAWFDIAQANPTIDPKQLQVGQIIQLPSRDTPKREEVRPPAPGRDQTYTVRPGDNLSRIANKFYGDSAKWDLIYARNRQKIGPRPDAIKVGMELVIPQAYDGAE